MSYEEEAEKRLNEIENRIRNDWVNVMQTDSGKRLITYILEFTGYKQSPFDKNNSETCKKIGRADVGRYIELQAITHCPDEWLTLIKNGINLFDNDRSLINVGEHHD